MQSLMGFLLKFIEMEYYKRNSKNTTQCTLYSKCMHVKLVRKYVTDLMQRHTCEWHALESNPLSTKISSIYHQVRVDAVVKYARRKHSQEALTE